MVHTQLAKNYMNAVDTNVFVYSLDVHEPAKQAKAKALLAGVIQKHFPILDFAANGHASKLLPSPISSLLNWRPSRRGSILA